MSLKCVNLPKPVKTKHSPIRIKQLLVSSVEIDLIKVHLPSYLGPFLGLLNDLRQLSVTLVLWEDVDLLSCLQTVLRPLFSRPLSLSFSSTVISPGRQSALLTK